MTDCPEPGEEDVPGGTDDAQVGHPEHHKSAESGGGNEGGGRCPRERLEEEDQTGVLWEEEEGEEEEGEDTSDTTGDEEEVDPRVAENLEIMNQSCAEVNRLENELDEARSKHRSTFQTSSQRMEELGGKIQKSIQKARRYFDLTNQARQAQNEALRAARQYQTANGNYRAAIEMATLAEKGLEDTSSKTRTLSSAWQETLSHAVERVTEAEREKTHSESEHHKKAAICAHLETEIHSLEKKFRRSIAKARPYFETKAELELKLQQLKQNVWDLQHAIGIQKARYAEALRCLEAVSTEIHESRQSRKKLLLQYPREPGVGAETDSMGSSISDANIERGVFSSTSFFPDEEEDDDDESDDVGDVFSPDAACSSRQGTPTRSLSRRSAHKKKAGNSSLHSRSLSNASAFSSEGHSDSASESPCSPTSMPSISAPASPASAPRLTDLARGDVGSSQHHSHTGEGQSPAPATEARCGNDADPAGTRTPPGVQQDLREDVGDSHNLPVRAGCPSPCQREAGDGSAQEDGPKEADGSSQLTLSAQSSLCSQFSSALTPLSHQPGLDGPQQGQPLKAATTLPNGAGGETAGTTAGDPSTQAVSGEVKKTPLRRTDVSAHRPLQGVMLLNPSDLAASSYNFGPRS